MSAYVEEFQSTAFPESLSWGEDTILGVECVSARRWLVETSRFLGYGYAFGGSARERVCERKQWVVSVSRSGSVRVWAVQEVRP